MANKNFRVKHGLEVAGSATVESNLTVTGNLTVNGTTTTLNTENLLVEDNIVVLNSNVISTPTTNAGIEIQRGLETNSALTWNESDDKWYQNRGGTSTVLPVSTSELVEGTNLYYTDARARAAVSGGTGVTYSNSTGVIAIGQPVGTTDDVVFDTVDANITDDNYVLGQLIATRNTSYVPVVSALSTVSGQNGIAVSSSAGNGNGYGANIAIRYHSGDTTAGVANAASATFSGASGTSTSPGGNTANQVLGSIAWDGYTAGTSNNYTSQIATVNQGAGLNGLTAMQAQGYARQAFTNSVTLTTAVTGASGTGTVATLTFTTQNTAPYAVGQSVTIAGMTPSGYNGTYTITAATTSSISYANTTTGFTSGGTIAAANTVTAAGMGFRIRGFANSTPMTIGNRFNFMDLTASAATFKSDAYTFANSVITGSTLTQTNYLTMGSTGITLGNVDGVANFIRASGANTGTRPVAFLRNTTTATTTPANNDGASFRLQAAGSNGTGYHLAQISGIYSSTGDTAITFDVANGDQNGAVMSAVQPFATKPSGTTIRATASVSATPGANTLTDIASFQPTSTTFSSGGTSYAQFASGSASITTSGRFTVTRTTPGSGLLLTQKTANADPANNDEIDFRLGITGTSTSSNFAKFDGFYKSTGAHEVGISVSTDSFTADADRIYVGSRESTKIQTTPAGGGTVSATAEFTQLATTIKSDAVTLKDAAGTALIGNNINYNRVYGQWQYDTTVTPAGSNTAYAYPIASGVTDYANIASTASTSRIIPGAAGMYKLQFSIQIQNDDSAAEHIAYFWWRKNGTDVPGSMGQVGVVKATGGVNGLTIAGWDNMISSANSTDYWELMYAVDDATHLDFPAFAATAFGPATASLFITLVPIGA